MSEKVQDFSVDMFGGSWVEDDKLVIFLQDTENGTSLKSLRLHISTETAAANLIGMLSAWIAGHTVEVDAD
jgi:hypothetical protein